jgi:hypothetical protein
LGRVFRLRFHWRKCWRHHHLLLWSYQMAFVHQVKFRVPNRIIPSKRFRLIYLLVLRVSI